MKSLSLQRRAMMQTLIYPLETSKQTIPFTPSLSVDDLCPIAALLDYLSLWDNGPGPLFHWENGVPLTKPNFVEEVRVALTAANLPAHQYAGHSFRRVSLQLQQWWAFRNLLFRPWVDGRARHISNYSLIS